MKKIFVLLALCCGASMVAHAVTQPAAPLGTQSPSNHVSQAPLLENHEPASLGAGSGDDIDTANEADTDNDNDPEAVVF